MGFGSLQTQSGGNVNKKKPRGAVGSQTSSDFEPGKTVGGQRQRGRKLPGALEGVDIQGSKAGSLLAGEQLREVAERIKKATAEARAAKLSIFRRRGFGGGKGGTGSILGPALNEEKRQATLIGL